MKGQKENVAVSIFYDSEPAGRHESFTALRATIRVYQVDTDFTYRESTITDSPENVNRLKELATSTANKWLKDIVFFLSVVPEPETIYYEPPVGCIPYSPETASEKGKGDK